MNGHIIGHPAAFLHGTHWLNQHCFNVICQRIVTQNQRGKYIGFENKSSFSCFHLIAPSVVNIEIRVELQLKYIDLN